jgi:hypothetical protein
MIPPVVSDLLKSLPSTESVTAFIPKISETKQALEIARNGDQLSAEDQRIHLDALDRALSAWRQKKRASSQFNQLCGLYEVARGLNVTARTLYAELEGRGVTDAAGMIQQIKTNLLGPGSLLEIPPRQVELMYQVLEPVLTRLTSDKLTPPLQRSVSDDVLATMNDEALQALPAEDNVVSATRRLINAILRYSKSFQQPNIDLQLEVLGKLTAHLKSTIDLYNQLETITYDVCELVHEHQLLDTLKLKESNRDYFDHLFPSEILTLEPPPEMQGAWREATLERQIRSDFDVTMSDCVRSHPVANALMAQYAQSKDIKTYEEARHLVLPEARKKLQIRLVTEILNKANDEVQQKDTIHRYPVEITPELKSKLTNGELVGAMQVIETIAIELLKRFAPELYHTNINVE